MGEWMSRTALAIVVVAASVGGCKTVQRAPIAFATASHGERDGVDYDDAGWVVGRSCEEYTGFFETVAAGFQLRIGDRDRPRSIRQALEAALDKEPRARFLGNVAIETEVTTETFKPVQVCTVVSGIAMVRADGQVRRSRPSKAVTTTSPTAAAPTTAAPTTTPGPAAPGTDRPVVGSDEDDDD